MKQQASFADLEYSARRKPTRREKFLTDLDRLVPWSQLVALIEPHYYRGERGRPRATDLRPVPLVAGDLEAAYRATVYMPGATPLNVETVNGRQGGFFRAVTVGCTRHHLRRNRVGEQDKQADIAQQHQWLCQSMRFHAW